MSDILVTSTGEIFYKIDSQIANLLMAALPTVFERVEPKEQKSAAPHADPTAVRFVVSRNPHNDKPQLVMVQGALVEAFQGTPDQLTNYGFGGRANRRPPVELVEQYRAAVERHNAEEASRRRSGRQ